MPKSVTSFDSFSKAKFVHDYFHGQLSNDMEDLDSAAERHGKLARDHGKLAGNEDERSRFNQAHAHASSSHGDAAHSLRFLKDMRVKGKATPELEHKTKMKVSQSNERTKHSLGLPSVEYSSKEMYKPE